MPADFRVSLTNPPGDDAYPIASFTWLLVYKDQPNEAKGKTLVKFLWWAIHDGQKYPSDAALRAAAGAGGEGDRGQDQADHLLRQAAAGGPVAGSRMAADSMAGVGAADRLSLPPQAISRQRVALGDRIYRACVLASVWLVLAMAAGLVVALCWESREAIRAFGLRFLVTSRWDPVAGEFGALPFIYGTLLSSLLALLIAVPLSLGAAIFLAELAPAWIRPPVAFLIEMLAAVPSVVYGLWGIFVLVPWLRDWVQPALAAHARLPAALPGAALRHRDARGGPHPGHHGGALHHVGESRGATGRPGLAARGRARARGHPVGGDPDRGAALRPIGPDRGHPARARPRARRDHGGDHGHRQPPGDRGVAVRAGLHHGERARQRVHRGDVGPLRLGAGGDRPAPAGDHGRSSTGSRGSWSGASGDRPGVGENDPRRATGWSATG